MRIEIEDLKVVVIQTGAQGRGFDPGIPLDAQSIGEHDLNGFAIARYSPQSTLEIRHKPTDLFGLLADPGAEGWLVFKWKFGEGDGLYGSGELSQGDLNLRRSGVPILQSLEITSSASDNTFIEASITRIQRAVSEGAQISDILAGDSYFPSMVKHMAKAGEETGNVDGMLLKVSDFYDVEIENTVSSLTDLMEPLIIVFLGGIIGTIVMAMFLPIFNMAGVVGGLE